MQTGHFRVQFDALFQAGGSSLIVVLAVTEDSREVIVDIVIVRVAANGLLAGGDRFVVFGFGFVHLPKLT